MQAPMQKGLSWLESIGFAKSKVTPIRGDVSPRRYFRVETGPNDSRILAAYPETERGAFERFLITTRLLIAARVRVPIIHAVDPGKGFMLLEDLGTRSVFGLTKGPWADLRCYLEAATAILDRLAAQQAAEFEAINPPLDADRLGRELLDARGVFLDHPAFSGDASERAALHGALDELLSGLAADRLVPSHRDFMSRNLMLAESTSVVAVIDHQDACLAPREYDLASLLNDSLFPSLAQERELLGVLGGDPRRLVSYRRCAVQRALKATATFVKFALRGSNRHLPLIAPTLARAALQLEQLPEGRSLPERLFVRWRDRARTQNGIASVLRAAGGQADTGRC